MTNDMEHIVSITQYALIVETTRTGLKKQREQLLVFPTPDGVGTHYRLVNPDTTGRGNSWKPLPDDLAFPMGTVLRYQPVAVKLSAKDVTAITQTGWSRVLAQKALRMLDVYPLSPADDTFDLEQVQHMVSTQSPELASLAHDARTLPKTTTPEPTPDAPAGDLLINRTQLLVPDKTLSDTYIQRTVSGVKDFTMLDYAKANHDNVLLTGPTGSGKTLLPLAYAASRELACYSISGNAAMDPTQLFGRFVPVGDGTFTWIDGPVTTIVREGGVLVLDEWNLIPARITTVLYPLLDARREITLLDHHGETIKAHPDLLVVGTGNLGYAGGQPTSEANLDRWAHRWTWDYDEAVEKALLASDSLREMATKVRSRTDNNTPMSTRLLVDFERLVAGLGWDYAADNLINRFTDPVDREAVKATLTTYAGRIKTELGLTTGPTPPVNVTHTSGHVLDVMPDPDTRWDDSLNDWAHSDVQVRN